jgi:cell division transport system permease protein
MFHLSNATTRRAKRGMLREWRLHMLSVFSLSVAFVCLAAALLVVTNLHAVEQRWAHAGRASIYLKDDAAPADVQILKDTLSKVSAITAVRYVSAGQARTDFVAEEDPKGQLAALPADAFPSSIEIDVRPDVTDAELSDVVAKLEKLPCVDDVETYQAWTERLAHLVRGGVAASAVLAIVVFASVLAVVGSTIRLALQRRKSEVEALKLVGATDRFVKGPFLIEGSFQGVMGATFAVALLAVLFLVVRGRLDSELALLLGIEPTFLPWPVALGMIVTGGVLGASAAALGLRRLVTV